MGKKWKNKKARRRFVTNHINRLKITGLAVKLSLRISSISFLTAKMKLNYFIKTSKSSLRQRAR